MIKYFDFESSLELLEKKFESLDQNKSNNSKIIDSLNQEKEQLYKTIYSNLSAWQKVQVARHSSRPHTMDYINTIFEDVVFLHGDKKYADDRAIVGCLAKISDFSLIIIGTEKGNSMDSRINHNFGMAKPEGYRKAQRLMKIAEKFNLPIITFVDTAGAFPGKEAEERGQSESIASSILVSLKVKTPIISIIIGEGGSGGAIGLATADKTLMLQHAIYSVISPEGCASILWRSTDFTQKAAETLKLTSEDCFKFKIIDEIIEEIPGGAHRFPKEQALILKKSILNSLQSLKKISIEELINIRREKYLNITSNI
ncbi:MAG: Acetyl-coenzyme A carboxylase carboxyl transferase subunit alpha [Alphaproteobacteria bacterium MarineAlpha5_Bin5]|nr:MAG: Acetyl-coenzyme A carboxylase carboxyl transferase subunit alpha [Alphaproteobacteria bacterium MarineAlpha5_Bin5]PPR51307.1 MAG: Acetyl-coenzyme A carboxylase carboxyl transferase subunit alpha [Alphaproteobacteria bacterium MarineAlpha5_Bin4]|tara:strand:+ start:60 stop:998 length:939 start_codon:yes stop_codon:yes gene_type:complete